MATRQPKKKPTKKAAGAKRRPGRPRNAEPRTQVNFRIDEKMNAGLDAICRRYKVGRTDLLRWMIDDIASGDWVPSHLRTDGNK